MIYLKSAREHLKYQIRMDMIQYIVLKSQKVKCVQLGGSNGPEPPSACSVKYNVVIRSLNPAFSAISAELPRCNRL